jgi:phytoene synthase
VFALYAFNAELAAVRERAREPLAGEVRLQWWRDAIEGSRGGEAAANPVAAALLDTIERHSLDRASFTRQVEAHGFDLYEDPMPTLAALQGYADATSGALIQLVSSVLGVPDAAAAIHAGRAHAFTGLLRAFALHASRGQLYVPIDLLGRHGATHAGAVSGTATPELLAALTEMRAIVRGHLDATGGLLGEVPFAARPAFLPIALVPLYLACMERPGYDPFRTPVEVPQWRRQWALWRAARRLL